MNKLDWSFVRKMAKQYKKLYPNENVKNVVKLANDAYFVFNEAEVMQKDEYYRKEDHGVSL